MQIMSNKTLKNGTTIRGECVMIDRNGQVYQCIDNLYHPNPGTKADGYSEIERTIDWLYQNNLRSIRPYLDRWIACRVAKELYNQDCGLSNIINNVMFCDLYKPCDRTISAIESAYKVCLQNDEMLHKYLQLDELHIAEVITEFLNESFLRVRAGGKLNPQSTNSIYFRISSHDYNWYYVISDFLYDTFNSIDKMPNYIWVGHDAETNPPEVTLFESSPQDLLEKFDSSIFADTDNEIIWL